MDNSTWTLTGTDSGNNAWNVQGGTLLVDGATRGAMTVQSGAFLGGIGIVGSTTVESGGTLIPGHGGIGLLTVIRQSCFRVGSRLPDHRERYDAWPHQRDRLGKSQQRGCYRRF